MSLAARIALEPSRRMAWLERSMPLVGVALVACGAVGRWPTLAVPIAAAAIAAVAALEVAVARRRPEGRVTLVVSDRINVGVVAASGGAPDDWRLDESTVAWPGFAVVSLVGGDGRVALRRVVPGGELPARDRRALARWLAWSVRARRSADERDAA